MIIGTALLTSLAWNAPLPSTYSNRLGLTLTPITTGVWAAERQAKRFGGLVDVGARTVLLRGADGKLVVYAPSTAPSMSLRVSTRLVAASARSSAKRSRAARYVTTVGARPTHRPNGSTRTSSRKRTSQLRCRPALRASSLTATANIVPTGSTAGCCRRCLWTLGCRRRRSSSFATKSRGRSYRRRLRNYPKSLRPTRGYGAEGTGAVHSCSKVPVDAVDTLPDARADEDAPVVAVAQPRARRSSLAHQPRPQHVGYVVLAGGRPAGTTALYRDQVAGRRLGRGDPDPDEW